MAAKQTSFFKNPSKSYGGSLLKKRKGRSHGRPLDTKNSMHLVMRSSRAKGQWSFRAPRNAHLIKAIVARFANKNGIKIFSLANVGNHLHFHIQLINRFSYRPFIRGMSAAIAMAVTGASRWNKLGIKFWDRRPFTRVVIGLRAFLTVRDYVRVNEMEGEGYSRETAYWIIRNESG